MLKWSCWKTMFIIYVYMNLFFEINTIPESPRFWIQTICAIASDNYHCKLILSTQNAGKVSPLNSWVVWLNFLFKFQWVINNTTINNVVIKNGVTPLCLFYKTVLTATRWQLEDGARLWTRSVSDGDPRQEPAENLLLLEFRRSFSRQVI